MAWLYRTCCLEEKIKLDPNIYREHNSYKMLMRFKYGSLTCEVKTTHEISASSSLEEPRAISIATPLYTWHAALGAASLETLRLKNNLFNEAIREVGLGTREPTISSRHSSSRSLVASSQTYVLGFHNLAPWILNVCKPSLNLKLQFATKVLCKSFFAEDFKPKILGRARILLLEGDCVLQIYNSAPPRFKSLPSL